MQVKIKKLVESAVIPSYAKQGDAGLDLTATSKKYDEYGNTVYGTSLAFKIPEGYFGLLVPRSSNSKTDLRLTNSSGILDSGYIGEVMFKYRNDNYAKIYYQMTNYDPFIYILYFAYSLCDYQIIQYELITSVNNSQQNYLNLLKAKITNASTFNNQLSVNLSINTGIKLEYLNYIRYYGIPKKGYFIPTFFLELSSGINFEK